MTTKVKALKPNRTLSLFERNRASRGYFVRKRLANSIIVFLKVILLFGLCFLILQPLINQFSLSVMSGTDLFDPSVISLPRNFTWANYRLAAYLMDYWWTLARSMGIGILVAVLQITACTLTAYGFARFNFPFKRF